MKAQRFVAILICVFIAGLLSGCDPGAYPYLVVNQILVVDNTPYIHVSEELSDGIGGEISAPDHYYASLDGAETWQEVSSVPATMPPEIEHPNEVQVTACVPNAQTICYHITGLEQVEVSYDSGVFWKIDWQMPAGRRIYMARNPSISYFLHVIPDTTPLDLGIVLKDGGHVVIVAMGNQGVLVKSSTGVWERRAIPPIRNRSMLATPLPFYASNIIEAIQSLEPEARSLLFLQFWLIFIYLIISRDRILNTEEVKSRKAGRKGLLPFLLAIGLWLFLLLFFSYNFLNAPYLASGVGTVFLELRFRKPECAWLLPIAGIFFLLLLVKLLSPGYKGEAVAILASFGYTVLFGIIVYAPFLLWAYGTILNYEIALAVSTLLGVTTAILGGFHVNRLALRVTQRQQYSYREPTHS